MRSIEETVGRCTYYPDRKLIHWSNGQGMRTTNGEEIDGFQEASPTPEGEEVLEDTAHAAAS